MYAVVLYYNYGKDMYFTVLKTFNLLKNAEKYALSVAEKKYGKELVRVRVKDEEEASHVIEEVIDGYIVDNGCGSDIYTIIKMDKPEDKDEENNQQENECNE